ncbi:dihydroxyacetone kinase subunit DhaL [Prescottella soli]|uniref:Dihydroxyacetone kinase subunit DhaL n=1 Tax=Prescottella soli TaxID=1543852 RepID=A0ABW9G049_9NOCA
MTTLQLEPTRTWIMRFAADVEAQVDTLTELDRQVGDGDFGFNLRSAVRAALAELEARPPERPGAVFSRVSDAFLGTGGTSGPLLGLWFGRIAAVPGEGVSAGDLAAAVDTATQAVRRLGKADVGDKTMVDAMVPAAGALLASAATSDDVCVALAAARVAAAEGAESTRELVARRGRASYVGEHARGVVDPGACAIAMFFAAAPVAGEDS